MTHAYKYLREDPWSRTRLLFVADPRKLRADYIYGQSIGAEARTPEELAADLELPMEAVLEAIDYCTHNADLIRAERERENALLADYDRQQRPLAPPATPQHV